MGLIKDLFRRKFRKQEPEEENWEEVVYHREAVNFHDQEQRSRYVMNCLEQMGEASRELDLLSGEYKLVTSYLADTDEIEALPAADSENVKNAARKLVALEGEMQKFRERNAKMSDSEFHEIKNLEKEIPEGIEKIKENEHQASLIKKDLRRLDAERHACEYRREELEKGMNNYRGMAIIFVTAFLALMLVLVLLQFAMEMDVVAGYLLAIAFFAIALTVVCVKYMDADREHRREGRTLGQIIQLQNTVKIRYVNNRRLLDYYYLKFHTENGVQLEKKWALYLAEKDSRKQYEEAAGQAEGLQTELVRTLSQYRVRDPERWVHQISALLDPREMVEVRHGLILRRQALRSQMEYNQGLAEDAKEEITEVAREYPQYAMEILETTERFEQEET